MPKEMKPAGSQATAWSIIASIPALGETRDSTGSA